MRREQIHSALFLVDAPDEKRQLQILQPNDFMPLIYSGPIARALELNVKGVLRAHHSCSVVAKERANCINPGVFGSRNGGYCGKYLQK
jgi:hypothetical protein